MTVGYTHLFLFCDHGSHDIAKRGRERLFIKVASFDTIASFLSPRVCILAHFYTFFILGIPSYTSQNTIGLVSIGEKKAFAFPSFEGKLPNRVTDYAYYVIVSYLCVLMVVWLKLTNSQ